MAQGRVAIPGSEAIPAIGGSWLPVDADQQISPTIVIRRPKRAGDVSGKLLAGSLPQMSREEAESFMRVDPADLAAVHAFVEGYGLTVTAENAAARTVHVEGSVMLVGQAFGVEIEWRVDAEERKYLSYQGELTVPEDLAGIVTAVLGLDQRPVARSVGR
jgi:kumamolisin